MNQAIEDAIGSAKDCRTLTVQVLKVLDGHLRRFPGPVEAAPHVNEIRVHLRAAELSAVEVHRHLDNAIAALDEQKAREGRS